MVWSDMILINLTRSKLSLIVDLISRSIKALQFKHHRPEIQRPFSIEYNDRRSHARGHEMCIPHKIPRAWEQQR